MSSDMQSFHEKMSDARSILLHLQELYGEHSQTAQYEISRELFRAKMSEGGEVGEHVLKMISMIERLEALDFSMDYNLQVNLILQSLPDSFSQFIVNFNMNNIECTLMGLLNKLVSTQSQMKTKGKDVVALTISTPRPLKPKKKNMAKKQYALAPKAVGGVGKNKGKASTVRASESSKQGGKCFHGGEANHWKRDCP
ncbi:uncharacterized protein LOC120254817 [Dioscorea cayenensis subsp. rotundata]|uniref:Uncharacterized protein LOC120254817 n=1 Tax=Dioscorea cayennensis subsp. rotundata TaxID=55577 RepID=A0AB40AUW1_DIOCR|nr:uncharacterized protein LOC120254817 [Dioscorea cayenensis subsp. rotundata]